VGATVTVTGYGVTIKGQRVAGAWGGQPLDGVWHADVTPWSLQMDDPGTPGNGVSPNHVRIDAEGEVEWMRDDHDMPGMGPMPNGTTFDHMASFQWRVYDTCADPHHPKIVAESPVIVMHVWSTQGWPQYNVGGTGGIPHYSNGAWTP
jgi:hypothetical protein